MIVTIDNTVRPYCIIYVVTIIIFTHMHTVVVDRAGRLSARPNWSITSRRGARLCRLTVLLLWLAWRWTVECPSVSLTTYLCWHPDSSSGHVNVHPSQGLCKASVGAVAWVACGHTSIKPDRMARHSSSRPRHHVDVGQTCPRTTYGAKSWVCNL